MYLLAPLVRGGRGDDSCRGGVAYGGLWWPEEASGAVGVCVAAVVAWAVVSPESGDEMMVSGGSLL